MAKRPRKGKTLAAARLVEALQFCSLASRVSGNNAAYQDHVRIADQWAIRSNGQLTAGHPVEEDLHACPHAARLANAIEKCGDTLSITHLGSGNLSVKGAVFTARVDCLPEDQMLYQAPDEPCGAIDDRIKRALHVAGSVAAEGATRVIFASVLLKAQTAIGTNGHVMLECYHGIDLPPGLCLPKSSVVAVLKVAKPLVSFGFSRGSMTFYYEDGSWLKSQLYLDPWPDTSHILDIPAYPITPPDGWITAVEAVTGFSADGRVYFDDGKVMSHPNQGEGAEHDMPGVGALPSGYYAKDLRLVEEFASRFDFTTHRERAIAYGDDARAVIMGTPRPVPSVAQPTYANRTPEQVAQAEAEHAERWRVYNAAVEAGDLNADIPF